MNPTLLLLNLAHAYDHFFLLIFPTAVLALAPAWGLSYAEALALGTPLFVMFAAGTLPVGWLGDRWDRRHLITIFFTGIGVAAILTGLAQGPTTLALGLGLMGLFASIYHPIGTALVIQSSPAKGRALGVNGVFGNFGIAAAALVTGGLTELFGWRMAFILPGAIAIATGLAFARIADVTPGEHAARSAGPANADRRALIRVFVVVGASALFGGIVFHGTTIALPKVFEERLAGLVTDLAAIGLMTSAVFAIAAFAQIGIGRLLDRHGARPILPVIMFGQAACLFAAAQLFGLPMLAIAAPMMLLVFGAIPISSWLVGHYTPAHWRSRVFAVEYTLSLGVSALVVPLIAALHAWTGGFTALFVMMAAAALLVAFASLLLPSLAQAPATKVEPLSEGA